MTPLAGKRLLLSAAFPSGERGEAFRPYDTAAIGQAVTSIAEAVLRAGGRIVFGAHPAISPLVLMVAGDVGRTGTVDVFQSRHFEGSVPAETLDLVQRGFGAIRWTEGSPDGDLTADLRRMRSEMIDSGPLAAAIFIGGMEGVREEYDMVATRQPSVPLIPIRSAGGAAASLQLSGHAVAQRLTDVVDTPFYPVIAHDIVEAIAKADPPE